MTDRNEPYGPPPSYDEVQNMSGGGAPPYPSQPYGGYPTQPGMPQGQYPDQGGVKYDQYGGTAQYPMQGNYGQQPYPMQGAQYPYGGASAGVYPPQPPPAGGAVYNTQAGVTVQPTWSTAQLQRRKKLFSILFGFVFLAVFAYVVVRILT